MLSPGCAALSSAPLNLFGPLLAIHALPRPPRQHFKAPTHSNGPLHPAESVITSILLDGWRRNLHHIQDQTHTRRHIAPVLYE